jgi:hypothetical protein
MVSAILASWESSDARRTPSWKVAWSMKGVFDEPHLLLRVRICMAAAKTILDLLGRALAAGVRDTAVGLCDTSYDPRPRLYNVFLTTLPTIYLLFQECISEEFVSTHPHPTASRQI